MSRSALPRVIETVLFDAGGVLVDLDYAYVRRLIGRLQDPPEVAALSRSEARARLEIEKRVKEGGRVGEAWRDYFHSILGENGVPAEAQSGIIDTLWEAHQRHGLWGVAIPGSVDVVKELRSKGYRVGVVSNAEGRVERDLGNAGYEGLFETVVDSHLVGVEKPDKRIFEIALERMDGTRPETTVFIGDVPSVDVAGARNAGLAPILLDRHDLYADVQAPRLASTKDLPLLLDEARGR